MIIVSGGGWGIGDVAGGIETALERPTARVVALCGRNEVVKSELEARFPGEERLTVMGFTDRMATVLSAGDVLIHATGGLTALEAIICGTNVISYGFGAGHVRENNKAYVQLGLAQVVKHREDLGPAIDEALAQPTVRDPRYAQLPSTAELSEHMNRFVKPIPAWRLVGQRVAVGLAVFAGIAWLALGSGTGLDILGGPLRARTATSVPTGKPVVGVIVDAPQERLAQTAGQLKAEGLRASLAVTKPLPTPQIVAIRAAGSDLVPHLDKGGVFRWLATRSRLRKLIRDLQLHKPFAYQPPYKGFSLGEYEAARSVGGKPVKGKIIVDPTSTIGQLFKGEIVAVDLTSNGSAAAAIAELKRALAERHLRAVPVTELFTQP